MHTMMVVIMPELSQFFLQVACVPEKCVVEIFVANGSDQPLDEGMRERRQLPGQRTVRNKPSR